MIVRRKQDIQRRQAITLCKILEGKRGPWQNEFSSDCVFWFAANKCFWNWSSFWKKGFQIELEFFTVFKKVCNDSSAQLLCWLFREAKKLRGAGSLDEFRMHALKMKISKFKSYEKNIRSIRYQNAMIWKDYCNSKVWYTILSHAW